MLNKTFLLGCAIAFLTACGGSDLELGPNNPDYGKPIPDPVIPPTVELDWDFDFEDATQATLWEDRSGGNMSADFAIHGQQTVLGVNAHDWTSGANVSDDNLAVIGMLPGGARDVRGGVVYMSIFLPAFYTDQNPWNNTDDDGPEDDPYNFGFNVTAEDINGNEIDVTGWKNVYEFLGSVVNAVSGLGYSQRTPDPAVGDVAGRWFDLKFTAPTQVDDDFDATQMVGIGFSLARDGVNADLPSLPKEDEYIYLDNILVEVADGGYVEPPSAPLRPFDGPVVFGLDIYTDGFSDFWTDTGTTTGDWSWGLSSVNLETTAQVKSGSTALEIIYDATNSGYKLAGDGLALDTSGYSEVMLSVYTEDVTTITVEISNDWDNAYVFETLAGEWTNARIRMEDLGSPASLSEIVLKLDCETCTFPYSVLVDEWGFDPRLGGAPTWALPIYSDGFTDFWTDTGTTTGDWSWGITGITVDGTTMVQNGSQSLEVVYEATNSGYKLAGDGLDLDISGYTEVQLSVYTEDVVDLTVEISNDWDNSVVFQSKAGAWTTIIIPLADLGAPTNLSEIALKLDCETCTFPYTVYVDDWGFDAGPPLPVGPPTWGLQIYNEGFTDFWVDTGTTTGDWSWGIAGVTVQSDAMAQFGDYSLDVSFEATNSGYKLAGDGLALDISSYTEVQFSVYTEDAVDLTVEISNNWDNSVLMTTEAGKWNTYIIPLADLGSPTELSEIAIKLDCETCTYPYSIHIDEWGFDPGPPSSAPSFDLAFYVDGFSDFWTDTETTEGGWSWGITSVAVESETQVQNGMYALEVVYEATNSGYKLAGNDVDLDISAYTELQFSVFAPDVVDLTVEISNDWDNSFLFNNEAGKWTTVIIPLSDLGYPISMTEIAIKLDCETCVYPYAVYVDDWGLN